ncbi:MAG TPA: VWA domain-containing protein [Thermoanaerobaculia bacterium]|nr:VWA domain-containing protein [Thermoanaerobaculia bacterium]
MRRVLLSALLAAAVANVAAQGFRERVDVEIVRLEVLATDSQGHPVRDLKAGDLRATVDGKPVSIDGFETPPSPDAPAALPSLPGPRPANLAPDPARPTEAPRAAPSTYWMAFLADETSSEQSNRQAVYAEMFRFFEAGLAPGVQAQLMVFDGRLRVECPWTADADRLRRTVAIMSKRPAVARVGQPGSLSGNPEHGSFRVELDSMEANAHVRTSLAGLFDSLRTFPESPGRKALYFLSDGAPFLAPSEIARDLIATSTSSADGNDPVSEYLRAREAEMDRDLLWDSLTWNKTGSASLLTDISRLALLRGIEIHPVRSAAHDFSGRVRTDRSFSGRASAPSRTDPRRSTASARDAETVPTTDIAAGQSMEAIAETTGGDAVLSRRFFQDGLNQEVGNRDAFYVVTFRDPFAGDHRFHRIEVTSARSGVKLRYRRGYRVLDVAEALNQSAANRLYEKADDNPLGVRLNFQGLGMDKGKAVASVLVAYPPPPRAGGERATEDAMRIVAFAAVRDGTLRHLDLSGKAEMTEASGSSWLMRSGTITLPPGSYRWSFAIRDEQTGITSYLAFDRALP